MIPALCLMWIPSKPVLLGRQFAVKSKFTYAVDITRNNAPLYRIPRLSVLCAKGTGRKDGLWEIVVRHSSDPYDADLPSNLIPEKEFVLRNDLSPIPFEVYSGKVAGGREMGEGLYSLDLRKESKSMTLKRLQGTWKGCDYWGTQVLKRNLALSDDPSMSKEDVEYNTRAFGELTIHNKTLEWKWPNKDALKAEMEVIGASRISFASSQMIGSLMMYEFGDRTWLRMLRREGSEWLEKDE